MILIGSRALAFHMDIERHFNDTDIVGTYEEIQEYVKACKAKVFYPIKEGRKMFIKNTSGRIIEADIAWPDSVEEKLMNFILADKGSCYKRSFEMVVPSLNLLYMLKLSHRYLKDSVHFDKTRKDILLMRKHGAVLQESHLEFYSQRMKDTYVYGLPKLNVSKGAFFDEVSTGVVYTYDHDSLHIAMKHLDKPAYKYYSGGEVWSSKEKFFAQTQEVRLLGVYEEATVLALERSLIPFPGGKTPKEAFDMALMKLCTSISSGFFRQFAWEHYDAVQALYSDTYVDKFNAGVADGTVKLNGEV